MAVDIERLLVGAGLRYTKEADPGSGERFHVPFDTSQGTVTLTIQTREDSLVVSNLLRSLDALPVRSRKDLFFQLLRVNANPHFARAFIWRDDDDETDWIGVVSEVPLAALTTPELVGLVVGEAVSLSQDVLELAAAQSESRQTQLH